MATKTISAIPFAVYLRRLFRQDFVFEHEVEFGVARADGVARVIIQSDRYDNPRIVERCEKGGTDLDDGFIDDLALMSFRLMAGQMRQRAGDSGWMTVKDVAPYIRKAFDSAMADSVIWALTSQVKAGVGVMSMCMIDGDDPF